jgi:hypothetical protein
MEVAELMIKVKLYELDKHRNETTFRPLLFQHELFSEMGIKFVTDGSADFAFVGQASFLNKKLPLSESVEQGINFLKTVKEPYFLFDGQDSTSLIGSYDVMEKSNAIYLIKNNLLKDRSLYKNKYINGRYFWGEGNYSCNNFDSNSSKIILSGFNWLNTYGNNINIVSYNKNRKYDVCCLIGLSKENYEHNVRTDSYYNSPRQKLFDEIKKLKCTTITTEKNGKLDRESYFKSLMDSKICISPYGYGEIAIRDIEAISAGCIIIKPDMSFVDTIPNVYESDKTYISCKPDYSDLYEKVNYVLDNYEILSEKMYKCVQEKSKKEFDIYKLLEYYHSIFINLPNVTT